MNVKPWSTISPGHDWFPVTGFQYLLKEHGHPVLVDGLFGPATEAAVKAFQSSAGIAVDGIVGPQTWSKLVVTTKQGSTGDAVRAVQAFGLSPSPGVPPLVVDGIYGPTTAGHVRFYQESWGLTQDGIAGQETWSFLSAATPGSTTWPLVKVGATQATNWRVLAAQHLLREHGSGIVADGIFGPLSGAAVSAFQQTLRTDEISTTIGQLDWPHLIVTVKAGDNGEAVRAVQTMFGSLAVDGVFGPQTDAAVRDYQQMLGLTVDGIVGPVTWHVLTLRLYE
ncbi:peptidoglycan-binding protein [Microbacter sp. GSS18]|nr:peptidoglycan-binding protein [Microbacter sp. GSS18]